MAPAAQATLCDGVQQPPISSTCQSGWLCTVDGWVERYYTTSQNISCDDGNACTYGDKCVDGGGCVGTAITCTSTTCQTQTCNGTASCTVTNASTAVTCTDNNACTAGDHCNGTGACSSGAPVTCSPADSCHAAGTCSASSGCSVGAPTCPAQLPGPLSGPSTSSNGSYLISWGASSLAQSYNVFENGTGIYTAPAGTLSVSISARSEGWYYYEVQACNSAGCSARTNKLAVAVSPPGTCGGLPKPPIETCQSRWICTVDNSWSSVYYAASLNHMCNDGDACSDGDACAGGDVCSGRLSCPPNAPGAIVVPTSSVNGIYTIAWGASKPVRVDRYELYQNGALIYTAPPSVQSHDVPEGADGVYRYKVWACNTVGCSAFTPEVAVTLPFLPAAPTLQVPVEIGAGYSCPVTWAPGGGRVAGYEVDESSNNSTWVTTSFGSSTLSHPYPGKPIGKYYYRARACNSTGCSANSPTKVLDVITALASFPDTSAPDPNVSSTAPAQQWVGAVPGSPSVEGGAATYRVPIEIPPGRAGMQPDVALAYSSRNGNGLAGVGWAISAGSTIYRCPRTLAQEGGNRPVLHDSLDRLCLDGQRLIANNEFYVSTGTQYRTDIDTFTRITLHNHLNTPSAYFDVEEKSGRVARYQPRSAAPSELSFLPDTWYRTYEYDPRGNCIRYEYHDDPEHALSRIVYTGTISGGQCLTATDARSVEFAYTQDRPDRRTTFAFGIASMMVSRVSAIHTTVGGSAVRTYDLGYKTSTATNRSLLRAVTLCVGGDCGSPDAKKLPSTTFVYSEEDQVPRFASERVTTAGGQPLGPDDQVLLGADYDGDGTRESFRIHQYPSAPSDRWVTLSSCGGAEFNLATMPYFAGFARLTDSTPLGGAGDMDEDGRVDILGAPNGIFTFARIYCPGTSLHPLKETPTDLSLNLGSISGIGPSVIDYDGDGIPDLKYFEQSTDPSTGSSVFTTKILRHRIKDPVHWLNQVDVLTNPPGNESMIRDINGDGMVDTVSDWVPGTPVQPTKIAFFKGLSFSGSQQYDVQDLSALGGPAGSFTDKAHPERRWIDVNGDGLPDIYEAGTVWINHGGISSSFSGANALMFEAKAVGVPTCPENRLQYSFAMDIDADGSEELMVPDDRIDDYCGGNHDVFIGTEQQQRAWFCGVEFDGALAKQYGYQSFDRSVFRWSAYKFVQAADGNYSLKRVSTNLEAPVNDLGTNQQDDFDGRGITSLRYNLHHGSDQFNYYQFLPDAAMGVYASRALMAAPDVMTKVTNGLGATATWQHQPLSQATTVEGCDMPLRSVPGSVTLQPDRFYEANNDDVHSSGYSFFASSMWTVSKFETSNGLGAGMNKVCYRYKNGMLNTEGRGFQGFKIIVAEEQNPAAAGEGPGGSGCGDTCSPNNLRTTTEFYQEFPFTSRLKKVTVSPAAFLSSPLSETTYWWDAEPSDYGSAKVLAAGSVEKKYNTAGDQAGNAALSTTTVVSEFDAASGDAAHTCVVSTGRALGTTANLLRSEARSLANDTTAWWLGKVLSTEVISDYYLAPNNGPLDGTCQLSGTPSSSWTWPGGESCAPGALPRCPTWTAATPPTHKKQTTNYAWNADRTLQSVTQLLGAATESQMVFDSYDGYGNVSAKHVVARDVSTASTFAPSSALITLPQTTYQFTSDHYFATSETNPLGHTSTTAVDPATGEVLAQQDVQGGPITRMRYDCLGRLTTTATLNPSQPVLGTNSTCDDETPICQNGVCAAQPVEQRLLSCSGGDCVLQRQTLQAGAPTKTEYLDRLGRVIASGVEGFDGNEVISKVDYNARGAKIAEHQPVSTGLLAGAWNGTAASPFMTQYSGFDALGRAGTKTVIRLSSPDLFEPGKGTANLVSDYLYAVAPAGIKTSITVQTPTSASGRITMSRTYDPRGKLVETVQDVSSPTVHTITTSYSYDPAGNLLVITDSKGNQLKAFYDDLGRKTEMDDPDRGNWFYGWDGLGRVRTQKDARGITLAYQYDAIGRMERRFMQQSAAGPWLLEANWRYDLNGNPGTLGAMLGAADPVQGTLTDTTKDWFHRDYKYDSLLRPWSVATHIPGGTSGSNTWTAHDFVTESGYDRNYGRLKAMKYPSGEIVSLDYDARGNPLGEAQLGTDGIRGVVYRHVDDMSVRGQVTMQTLGNSVVESNTYDESTGMPLAMNAFKMRDPQPAGCPNPPVPDQLVQQVDYHYDHFLNVARQEKQFLQRDATTKALLFSGCQPLGATASETYSYDELQRLLGASRTWTGMTASASTIALDSYSYDDLGNIKSKSDYGDAYTYGTSARALPNLAGPHAVTSVTKGGVARPAFSYDNNGNMTSGDGRTVAFDNLDRAISVTANNYTTQFRYAPDGQRYVQSAYNSTTQATTNEYYDDKLYERVESALSPVERNYVSDSVMIVQTGASRAVRYRHLDRLGSLDAVSREDGSEDPADAHGYDAFGKPRARDFQSSADISTWQMQPGDNVYTTERGFTGHEHLDDLYLIHMNGRVYDYRLGRFLSVDPIISNPANSQSINPYSYIGNNPLSGVDPTGYAEQTLSGPGGCTLMTGSHICNTAGAGDNLWVAGLPVIGGRLSPASTTSSGAGTGAATGPQGMPGGGASEMGSPRQTATAHTSQSQAGAWNEDAKTDTLDASYTETEARRVGERTVQGNIVITGARTPTVPVAAAGPIGPGWWFHLWGNWGGVRGGPNAGGRFPPWMRDYVRSFGKCNYCLKDLPPDQIQVDHVTPRVDNGSGGDINNTAPACPECNNGKGGMSGAALKMLMDLLKEMGRYNFSGPLVVPYGPALEHPNPVALCSGKACDS
jgi:RHS repeat-associated protein